MLKTYTKPWSSLLVAIGAMSSTPVVRQMNKINENILGFVRKMMVTTFRYDMLHSRGIYIVELIHQGSQRH